MDISLLQNTKEGHKDSVKLIHNSSKVTRSRYYLAKAAFQKSLSHPYLMHHNSVTFLFIIGKLL